MEERKFLKHQHMEQAVKSLLASQAYPFPILSHITIIPLTGKTDILASTEEKPQIQSLQL